MNHTPHTNTICTQLSHYPSSIDILGQSVSVDGKNPLTHVLYQKKVWETICGIHCLHKGKLTSGAVFDVCNIVTPFVPNIPRKKLHLLVYIQLRKVFWRLTEWVSCASTLSAPKTHPSKTPLSDGPIHKKSRSRPKEEPLPMALLMPSQSRPNVTYEVNALNCTCTCPDFVHEHKANPQSTCKHLRELLAGLFWSAYKSNKLVEADGYRWVPTNVFPQ